MTPPDPSTRLLVQATVESLQAEVRELRGRLAVAEQAVREEIVRLVLLRGHSEDSKLVAAIRSGRNER